MTARCFFQFVLILSLMILAGCSDWTGARNTPSYLPAPGQYAPPAQAIPRLRVAVPPAAVDNPVGVIPDLDVQAAASDELFALLDASNRYDLTERQRLSSILAGQGLSDMIQPGRLIHPAPVQNFDYMFLAHFSEFSVQREPTPSKVSMASMEKTLGVGVGWIPKLIVNAKVELSMVDVHTGVVAVTGGAEFRHTNTPQEFGLQLTTDQLLNTPEVRLNPADTHRLLKLILDDALRPMLPRLDRWAAALPAAHDATSSTPPAAPPGQNPLAHPASAPPAARSSPNILSTSLICPECGAKVRSDQEFCPVCGHKLR